MSTFAAYLPWTREHAQHLCKEIKRLEKDTSNLLVQSHAAFDELYQRSTKQGRNMHEEYFAPVSTQNQDGTTTNLTDAALCLDAEALAYACLCQSTARCANPIHAIQQTNFAKHT